MNNYLDTCAAIAMARRPLVISPAEFLFAYGGSCDSDDAAVLTKLAQSEKPAPIVAEVGMEVDGGELIHAICGNEIVLTDDSWPDCLVCEWRDSGWWRDEIRVAITHKGRAVVLPSAEPAQDGCFVTECDRDGNETMPEQFVEFRESPIEVGAHFRRKSDDRLCVVCHVDEPADGLLLYRYERGLRCKGGADWFADHHTHAYTPADGLSNLKDGDKIIDMESGEVVTVQVKGSDRFVLDSGDRIHGVNGLPAQSTKLGDGAMLGWWYRDECHCATGAADRYTDGRETFYLHNKSYTPEDWAREIVSNPEYDASKVEAEWRHLIDAAKAEAEAKPYSVRNRKSSHHYAAFLECAGQEHPLAKFRCEVFAGAVVDLLNDDVAKSRQLESEVRDGE